MESPKTVFPPTKIPSPYYAKGDPWLDHSIFGVETLIGSGILRRYDINVFDCSEMAAYLEWMLEKQGFDSKICLADRFANGSIGHAWVAIDIPPKRYFVEPTAVNTGGFIFSTIKPYDGNYGDYSRYDAIYEDIYEVTKNNPISEFDWWNDPQLAKTLRSLKEEDKGELNNNALYRSWVLALASLSRPASSLSSLPPRPGRAWKTPQHLLKRCRFSTMNHY